MRLHIGCGRRDFGPGWVNIDGTKHDHVNFVKRDVELANLDDVCADDSVDLIYCSHMLSYFDLNEAVEMLRRWRLKLRDWAMFPPSDHGVLRLSVPDFTRIVGLYVHDGNLDQAVGPLFGRQLYFGGLRYHKTVYDAERLRWLLEKAGYHNVSLWRWEEPFWTAEEIAKYEDCSTAKFSDVPISLNLQATR